MPDNSLAADIAPPSGAAPYRMFGILSFAFLIGSQVMGFLISPPDRDMEIGRAHV